MQAIKLIVILIYIIIGLATMATFAGRMGRINLITHDDMSVWEEYSYLGRDSLNIAKYNAQTKLFEIYKLDGKTSTLVNTADHDPSLYFYDIVESAFKEIKTLNIQIESNANATTITTGSGRRLIIRYDGMVYNVADRKLQAQFVCESGKQYPMTTKLYKTIMNVPSSEIGDGTTMRLLYAECAPDNRSYILGKCEDGHEFIGGKCAQPIGFTPTTTEIPDHLPVKFVPQDAERFLRISGQTVTVVNCSNGVDSTGVACNDVECIDKNGTNYIDAAYQSSFIPGMKPVARAAITCKDGHVTKYTDCGHIAYEAVVDFLDEEDVITNSIRIVHPRRYFAKRKGICATVRGDYLVQRPMPPTDNYYKALNNSVFVGLSKSGGAVFKQKFTLVENGNWVPSLLNPKKMIVRRNGTDTTITLKNPGIVYRNSVYESEHDDIPILNLTDPVPYFRVMKLDNKLWCTVIGNTVLDLVSPDPDNKQTEDEFISEMFNSPEDDLHHTPALIAFMKENRHEHPTNHGIRYRNTVTLYGIGTPTIDPDEWKHVWRDTFDLKEKINSRKKRV